ncbi:PilZ domain-containing protein [Novosphingobium sp. HBC54]|uniref:PilZ domain-containing protein n=2 Tax=Novosphingobium cyanobacteriorum TaxID=3024215 RepID=A0ABT6CGA6_9SPHN|nr:PilZ domain-containing protein [Novosphingobium cyanobacteriorum]
MPPSAPITGRRKAARVRLGIPCTVILLSGNHSCLLEDLSQTGARVATAGALPAAGADAVLLINGIETFGAIRWARNQRFGIKFDEPLALNQVVAIRDFADDYARHEQEQQLRNAREYVLGRRGVI